MTISPCHVASGRMATLAEKYVRRADLEAHGSSPLYEEWARSIVRDDTASH